MVEHVLVVGLLESEGLAADVTGVGRLARVQPFVLFQKVLCGEGFSAHIALPLLVVVDLHMLVQMRLSLEDLLADLALDSAKVLVYHGLVIHNLGRFLFDDAILNSSV